MPRPPPPVRRLSSFVSRLSSIVFRLLSLVSTSYDWLVIAGANAKYKGVGTINGQGAYKFMLTATDGDLLDGGKAENYFDFLSPDDIRIKGTRVGIETVLDDYLGASPEEIAARYHTLTLEQVYATITYYLHKQEEIDKYLERWRAYSEAAWQEQQSNPPEFVRELRERIQRMREMVVAERGPSCFVDQVVSFCLILKPVEKGSHRF